MKEQPKTKKGSHDDPLGIRAAISDAAKSPFIIRHMETHLIYGPIYRETGLGKLLYNILVLFLFGKNLSGYGLKEQIAVSFIILKGVLGFLAFIFLICSPLLYVMGAPDALADGFLGLIWLPGLEFVPKMTPHQKYITLSRIILTIPCIYLGIHSGNWGW